MRSSTLFRHFLLQPLPSKSSASKTEKFPRKNLFSKSAFLSNLLSLGRGRGNFWRNSRLYPSLAAAPPHTRGGGRKEPFWRREEEEEEERKSFRPLPLLLLLSAQFSAFRLFSPEFSLPLPQQRSFSSSESAPLVHAPADRFHIRKWLMLRIRQVN